MDLRVLQAFVAVARCGSIAAARATLGRSQPAISGQLQALEQDVGLALFERGARGMALTADGAALLPLAQEVLDAAGRMEAEAGRRAGEAAGQVRLGASATPSHLRLAELLARVAATHPRLRVAVHHATSAEVLRDVRAGRLDLGLVIGPAADEALAGLRLETVTVYVAAPAAWREEIARHGWPGALRGPWVIGHEDSFCGRAAREQARGATRLIQVDHAGAVLELVSAGVCAGVLHEEDALRAERAGKVLLWRERPLRAELWAVWDRARAQRSGAAAVLPILRRLWRSQG